MKNDITIRRSRRGNRTTIRVLVKGKAADDFVAALIQAFHGAKKQDQPWGTSVSWRSPEKATQSEGGRP